MFGSKKGIQKSMTIISGDAGDSLSKVIANAIKLAPCQMNFNGHIVDVGMGDSTETIEKRFDEQVETDTINRMHEVLREARNGDWMNVDEDSLALALAKWLHYQESEDSSVITRHLPVSASVAEGVAKRFYQRKAEGMAVYLRITKAQLELINVIRGLK